MSEVVEAQTLSISGSGAALTQVTRAAANLTINIPAGKGGKLDWVEITIEPTLETVLVSGGQIFMRNDSADWVPCNTHTASLAPLTEGGAGIKPYVWPVEKILPGNSNVIFDFLPYDNQSQILHVALHWTVGDVEQFEGAFDEVFSSTLFPLKANAVTATARAQITATGSVNNQIQIPGGKGGFLEIVSIQTWGTPETVVNGGGIVELILDSKDITPAEWHTAITPFVGASGAAMLNPMNVPFHHEVPANGNYTAFLTPDDDQSQTASVTLLWSRPFMPKR